MSTAAPTPATAAALAAQEERRRRDEAAPSRSLTSSRGRSRRPAGHASCSTPTPRAGRRSATAIVPTGRDRELEPVARRAAAATPASTGRCSCPRCSTASSRRSISACPPTTGGDGLFDGRVAVTLPRRSGRRPTLKTTAPSASATSVSTSEIDEVAGRRHLAEEERRPEALDHGRERVAPLDQVDEPGVRIGAGEVVEAVEDRREEEERQQQRRDDELDVAVDRVRRRDGERQPGDEQRRSRRRSGSRATPSPASRAGRSSRARARWRSSRRRRRAAWRRSRAARAGAGSAPCGSGSRSRAGCAPTTAATWRRTPRAAARRGGTASSRRRRSSATSTSPRRRRGRRASASPAARASRRGRAPSPCTSRAGRAGRGSRRARDSGSEIGVDGHRRDCTGDVGEGRRPPIRGGQALPYRHERGRHDRRPPRRGSSSIRALLRSSLGERSAPSPTATAGTTRPTPAFGGVGIFAGSSRVAAGGRGRRGRARPGELLGIVGGCRLVFAAGLARRRSGISARWRSSRRRSPRPAIVDRRAACASSWSRTTSSRRASAIVWLVGLTNAFNLLDNMDGLAARLAVVACAYFAHRRRRRAPERPRARPRALARLRVRGFLPYNLRTGRQRGRLHGRLGQPAARVRARALGPGGELEGSRDDDRDGRCCRCSSSRSRSSTRRSSPSCGSLERRPVTQGGKDHTSHRLVYCGLSERKAVACSRPSPSRSARRASPTTSSTTAGSRRSACSSRRPAGPVRQLPDAS